MWPLEQVNAFRYNNVCFHHNLNKKHIDKIFYDIYQKTKDNSKLVYNNAVKKLKGYFLLAKRFPRVHDNTPRFIRHTESVLTEGELHILFFSTANEPVFEDTNSNTDTDSDMDTDYDMDTDSSLDLD